MKVIFPIAWITGFGAGTLVLWLGAMHSSGRRPAPPEMPWLFLALWLLGTGFALRGCAGLKRVRTDGDCLYVSNYQREIKVPLSVIASVTENRWINIHPVTVHFRVLTEFGSKITFMPTARLFAWKPHPVVNELRRAAAMDTLLDA